MLLVLVVELDSLLSFCFFVRFSLALSLFLFAIYLVDFLSMAAVHMSVAPAAAVTTTAADASAATTMNGAAAAAVVAEAATSTAATAAGAADESAAVMRAAEA